MKQLLLTLLYVTLFVIVIAAIFVVGGFLYLSAATMWVMWDVSCSVVKSFLGVTSTLCR